MYWGNYLKRQLGLCLTVIVGMSLFLCTFFLMAVTNDITTQCEFTVLANASRLCND